MERSYWLYHGGWKDSFGLYGVALPLSKEANYANLSQTRLDTP